MSNPIDRAEWAWVIVVAAAVVFVSTIPYLAGWLVQSPEMRFTGAVFNRFIAQFAGGEVRLVAFSFAATSPGS